MDVLLQAAENFRRLTFIKYRFILGKRNKMTDISIIFSEKDFHHLAGLQYLKDMPELKQSRSKIFNKIIADENFRKKIYKSTFYPNIEKRLYALIQLEFLLDNNNIIFRYDFRADKTSNIKADFLIQTFDQDNIEIYIFGEKMSDINTNNTQEVYCKSMFPKETKDYTRYQSKFTVLKMIKSDTDSEMILKTYINNNFRENRISLP